MSFRNFVVADGAREASFLPKNPDEVSYGVGSPSISVNNQEDNSQMVEPIASIQPSKPVKESKPVTAEETS
jgi:hypothetical protein